MRIRLGRGTHDRQGWKLLALLVVAVVVPSACVLWFMAEANTNQADAARRTIADAYRGQLRVARNRMNGYWQSKATELESQLTGDAPRDFQRLATAGSVGSVVVLGPGGVPSYPTLAIQPDDAIAGGLSGSLEARAVQAAVRALVQAHDTRGAIDLISRRLLAGPAARGNDPDGRLIAADQQFLLITLLPRSDPRRAAAIERLTTLLTDYSTDGIPSAQRAFLMGQMLALEGGPSADRFPTLAAERMAIGYLEVERPRREASALRVTAVPDVWQLSTPNGRAVALFKKDSVLGAMKPLVDEQASSSVAFVLTPPGAASLEEAVAVGPALPGWEIAFVMTDQAAALAAIRGRRNAYLAMAVAAIAVIAAAVALLGGAASRQARLASLKSDLVSTVSHELKTPLASMRLLVDALLSDAELDPVKTREYLQLMAVENARLSRLIDNFLTFSRLERNRYQFSFQPTDPAAIVDETLRALPENRRGDHAPAVDIAPSLPAIVADRDALVTALLNLIDNAYKYTPGGEPVRVRAFLDGSDVVFAVQDHGVGIDPREQKRIFRRFYRVERRLARQTSGSGLGLSIVDAIVRAHGGTVRVESRLAHGSTFALHLPAATGVAA